MAISKASTHKFRVTFTKDRAAYVITGATVTLILIDPDGTVSTKAATVESASVAYYTLLTTDCTTEGKWQRRWRVVLGSVDITSQPTPFDVTP